MVPSCQCRPQLYFLPCPYQLFCHLQEAARISLSFLATVFLVAIDFAAADFSFLEPTADATPAPAPNNAQPRQASRKVGFYRLLPNSLPEVFVLNPLTSEVRECVTHPTGSEPSSRPLEVPRYLPPHPADFSLSDSALTPSAPAPSTPAPVKPLAARDLYASLFSLGPLCPLNASSVFPTLALFPVKDLLPPPHQLHVSIPSLPNSATLGGLFVLWRVYLLRLQLLQQLQLARRGSHHTQVLWLPFC